MHAVLLTPSALPIPSMLTLQGTIFSPVPFTTSSRNAGDVNCFLAAFFSGNQQEEGLETEP